MTYVITEPCIGVKDASCVDVCPVDCIYTREEDGQYYIDPDTCIDCAACEVVCPVTAIFFEDDVPEQWKHFTQINKDFFQNVPAAERTFRPRTERTAN
jgi:NAD-dependent dihydropyrimidine dehydrogenase PreA subunit